MNESTAWSPSKLAAQHGTDIVSTNSDNRNSGSSSSSSSSSISSSSSSVLLGRSSSVPSSFSALSTAAAGQGVGTASASASMRTTGSSPSQSPSYDFNVTFSQPPFGLTLTMDRAGYAEVTRVVTGGQAERLGVVVGDHVVTVNDQNDQMGSRLDRQLPQRYEAVMELIHKAQQEQQQQSGAARGQGRSMGLTLRRTKPVAIPTPALKNKHAESESLVADRSRLMTSHRAADSHHGKGLGSSASASQLSVASAAHPDKSTNNLVNVVGVSGVSALGSGAVSGSTGSGATQSSGWSWALGGDVLDNALSLLEGIGSMVSSPSPPSLPSNPNPSNPSSNTSTRSSSEPPHVSRSVASGSYGSAATTVTSDPGVGSRAAYNSQQLQQLQLLQRSGVNDSAGAGTGGSLEYEITFGHGDIGMRLEEQANQRSVVTSVTAHSQAHVNNVRVGSMVTAVNNEKFISHVHTIASIKHARRPIVVRFLPA